jgi:predicted GNAT family acetyltransferase
VSDIAIRHDVEAHRFEADVDGHVGFVEYARDDEVLVVLHTIVPDPIGGRGIAGQLVQAAVDYAQAQGLKLASRCWYASGWLDRHPEYAGLRA